MTTNSKTPHIFFITGTSGSGKSTLTTLLQEKLPTLNFAIHDFDEVGVPAEANATWRQATTDYWLTKAVKNTEKRISTIICGVIVPTEVINSMVKPSNPISFGFIHISNELIIQRLQERQWSSQQIQDNINWAHVLEKEVTLQKSHLIIDGSSKTPNDVAQDFYQWIINFNP